MMLCEQKRNKNKYKSASICKITSYLNDSVKQYSPTAVFLKEPIEKHWYLARYCTSLVSIMFFTKRERGDGGNSGRAIWTFSENDARKEL